MDQRCKRQGSVGWRCPQISMPGKSVCHHHFVQRKHQQERAIAKKKGVSEIVGGDDSRSNGSRKKRKKKSEGGEEYEELRGDGKKGRISGDYDDCVGVVSEKDYTVNRVVKDQEKELSFCKIEIEKSSSGKVIRDFDDEKRNSGKEERESGGRKLKFDEKVRDFSKGKEKVGEKVSNSGKRLKDSGQRKNGRRYGDDEEDQVIKRVVKNQEMELPLGKEKSGSSERIEEFGEEERDFRKMQDIGDEKRNSVEEVGDLGKRKGEFGEKVGDSDGENRNLGNKVRDSGKGMKNSNEETRGFGKAKKNSEDTTATSQGPLERNTIKECIGLLNKINRVSQGSRLYNFAVKTFLNKECREAFIALDKPELQLSWLNYMESCETGKR